MGMTEKEFKKSTPEYFMLRLYGMADVEREQSKLEWERARYIAIRARTAFADKFPSGYWDLPWDENKTAFTFEELDAINKMIDAKYPQYLN